MIKAVIFDMYETLITHYNGQLYFCRQMAEDAGIEENKFRKLWEATEEARSVGRISFEDVIRNILNENGKYSDELLEQIVERRKAVKASAFNRMNPEIIPMLRGLGERGIKLGLISNCYSEEAEVIKKSCLYCFFDAVCLSHDEGVMKPDREIFRRCVNRLAVGFGECIYVGDGRDCELEAAEELGMSIIQATWYFKKDIPEKHIFMDGVRRVESPIEILSLI